MVKVGIWGSSGFLGTELLKLLARRDDVDIVFGATSKEAVGTMEDVQIALLAVREKEAMELAPVLLARNIRVIDLSGAHRLHNPVLYVKYYKLIHTHPEFLREAIYGLPERSREHIHHARLVANPGCYATAMNLALLPLKKIRAITPRTKVIVRAFSGFTGAGRKATIPHYIIAYAGGRVHRHIAEVEQELGLHGQIWFYPEKAPWPRGIKAVLRMKVAPSVHLPDFYRQFYAGEPFVRIRETEVNIDDVVGTNFCDISVTTKGRYATIAAALDNLSKGGAGQAVQNLNIMCGLPEEHVY
ncbi:MAG: N-acetyl-gamma-glutamyl-phosphate reductase [Patescibacteria group bacterium]